MFAKVFHGDLVFQVEDKINEYLRSNPDLEVVSTSFVITRYGSGDTESALFVFRGDSAA